MKGKKPSVESLNRANADGVERSPAEFNQRAHILERLKNLKRVRFGSKDFWQGCEEVKIAAVVAPRGRAGDACRRPYALGRPRDRRAGRVG